MDSILTFIKNMLGYDEEYTHFDPDITMNINSAFSSLNQLGVGPSTGFLITDKSKTWNDFIGSREDLEFIKTKKQRYRKYKLNRIDENIHST